MTMPGCSVAPARHRPRRARVPLAVAALVALAALSLAASPASARATAPPVGIGAYIPGADRDPAAIDSWAAATGRRPVIVGSYRNWGPPLIEAEDLDAIVAREAVPMITWEPWQEETAPVTWEDDHTPVPLWSVAGGVHDAYIAQAAREAADWGKPIFVRFAHEMNGSWYPWGWGVGDGTPASFKAAWRQVVAIFRAQGAGNVRWVWCPYVSNSRTGQFRRFYPGDDWVDWACMDGFNWGSYRAWQSFDRIFAATYRALTRLTQRPIMIGEMGVNQNGGNKPRWVSRALRRNLPAYRNVRAVIWWSSADHRADFRVDSSAGALAAFRLGTAATTYRATAAQLLATPSELALAGGRGSESRAGARRRRR